MRLKCLFSITADVIFNVVTDRRLLSTGFIAWKRLILLLTCLPAEKKLKSSISSQLDLTSSCKNPLHISVLVPNFWNGFNYDLVHCFSYIEILMFSKTLVIQPLHKICIICFQTHFHIFFGFGRSNRLTTNNTSLYEYSTLTLLPFYKLLNMTLLKSQPLTYLSDSSRTILDSFLCNIWKIGRWMYIWDPRKLFTV